MKALKISLANTISLIPGSEKISDKCSNLPESAKEWKLDLEELRRRMFSRIVDGRSSELEKKEPPLTKDEEKAEKEDNWFWKPEFKRSGKSLQNMYVRFWV